MPQQSDSYSSIFRSAYSSLGVLDDESLLSYKLTLYNQNPDYFTPAEAEKLESQALSNGIYFQRKGTHATDDTGVIEQFVSGFVEGSVLLGWADEPDTQAEKIAAKIGHLSGFATDIIAAAFTGGASLTATSAKLAAKGAVKVGAKKGGAALGIQLGGDWAASKLGQAAGQVAKYTRKGGGYFGLEVGKAGSKWRAVKGMEGPIPIIGSLRSIPMRAADAATDYASKVLTERGIMSAGFFAAGTVPRHMIKSGIHLGLASAVSSVKEGPRAMVESFAWGGVAGVAFGGIGELTRIDRFLRHPNPRIQSLGKEGIRKGAGALMGAGFMGGMAHISGAPTEDQIYEFLLGAFFGASSRSVHEIKGNEFINKMQHGYRDAETGEMVRRPWQDIYRYKKTEEWDGLQEPAKQYVKEHIKKLTGTWIDSIEGTDAFAALAKRAKLENIDLTEAGEKTLQDIIKIEDEARIDKETGIESEHVVDSEPDLRRAKAKLLIESQEELAQIEKENKGLEIGAKGRFRRTEEATEDQPSRTVDMEGEDLYTVDRAFASEDEFRIGNIRTRDPGKSVPKGVGTRIFNAIKKEFIAKGRDHIDIEANPGSEGFWEKMGFEFVGETKEGYPIESSEYSGTKKPPKGESYGRYQYRYNLKPEIEAFEAKFRERVDYKDPSPAVDYYAKEKENTDQFSESKDAAEFEDFADFQLPRNRLDYMADDIQSSYPDVSLPEIRRDFHEIKQATGHNYAKFVAELSKKYPKVRLNEHDLKHFLLKDEVHRKVKLHTWSEVDMELRMSSDYGIDGRRNVESKPQPELDKVYGDSDMGPIKRVELERPDASGKMRRVYAKPFDEYLVEVEQIDGTKKWELQSVITEEGWRSMQFKLDEKGHYIISAKKDANVLIPYKYHSSVIKNELWKKENFESFIKDLEDVGYKEIRKDMDNDWALERKRYGLDFLTSEQVELHKDIWRKKVASNFAWAAEVEGARNWSELYQRWGYKDAITYNKRVSLMNGNEIPLKVEDFSRPGDKLLNKDGKIEFIFVNDVNKNGLRTDQDPETFKNLANEDIPYTSQLDGVIELPPNLWNRVLEANGFERDVGFVKPVIVIWHPKLGNMLVKAGAFKTGPTHLKLSGKNKMIIWSSSAKTKGLREPNDVQYNEKTKQWEIDGELNTYDLDPKHFKINLDVSESAEKAIGTPRLMRQIFGYANPEQIIPVDIDIVYDRITRRAIEGYSDGNGKFVYNDLVGEYFDKGISAKRKTEIEQEIYGLGRHWPDRLSRKVILEDIMSNNPNSRLAREFLKYIFEKTKTGELTMGEWGPNEKESSLEQMIDATRYAKILAAGKYKHSVWLYDESVYPVVERSVMNYLNQRMIKPRWRDGGGGAGYFYPYSVGEQAKFRLRPGDVVFGANWKDPRVLIKWTVDPNRNKVPLVEAWDQYQRAKKDKSATKQQLKIMEDDFLIAMGRSPMGGLSGIRLLKFQGFSEKPGWGFITHPKDDFYMGGLDKDGDAGKWYQGLPKEMKDMFWRVQNELELPDGRSLDIKEKALDSEFGISDAEPLAMMLKTQGSSFMPNMRIEAGIGAHKGNKAIGIVENAKQQVQAMISTLNAAGGEVTLPVIGKDNNKIGDLSVKIRTTNIKTNIKDNVIGDTFRYYGYNASNRAVDASNYPRMYSGQEIKALLIDKAFDMEITFTTGKKGTGTMWHLEQTEFGIIRDVNKRLFSKNYADKRAWRPDEIQEIVNRMAQSELPWQGYIAKMARDIAGERVDFNRAGELDPTKVLNFFRDKINQYRDPFTKDLIGRMGLRIGSWNLSKGYFKGDNKNAFRFDRDVEDAVGADLVLDSGKKAFDALRRAGKTEEESIDILHSVLEEANEIKRAADRGRHVSKMPEVSSAQTKYGLAERIRFSRENAVAKASAHGVDPGLFLKYWDMFFISPMRYQTKEMRTEFMKIQKELENNSKWYFDKFGEKLTKRVSEERWEALSPEEKNSVKGILKAYRKSMNDFHRTDQVSISRETNEIPIQVLQEYLAHKTKTIESLQKDAAPRLKKPLDDGNHKPTDAAKEASEIVNEILKASETPLDEWLPDYEMVNKYGDKAEETLPKEARDDLAKLVTYLSDPKNGPIKDSFAQFFAQFTKMHEGIGRPIQSLTPEDIKHLNKFFELADSGEMLLKYIENSKGQMVPVLSKWMHHSLYEKVGDHAFVADRAVISRYGIPLRKANGDIIYVRGKQPVSHMTYLTEIGQTVVRHKDKFVNFDQQYRDKEVTGLLLDETVIKDQLDIFDIAVKKYLKDGSGADMSKEDIQYYKELYQEAQPKMQELRDKGKIYRYVDKDGKESYHDIDTFSDLVINKFEKNFQRLFREWVDPTMNDVDFEKQFVYKDNGKMSLAILRKALTGISYQRETMNKGDILGIRVMLKIENELVMEEMLKPELKALEKQYHDSIASQKLTGAKKEKYLVALEVEQKKLRDSYRSALGLTKVGEILKYWPQLGHMSIKANQESVIDHINTKVANRYDSIMRNPEEYLSSAGYHAYQLGLLGKPGGRSLEELARAEVDLLNNRMQRYLQTDVMRDGGAIEHMMRFFEEAGIEESFIGLNKSDKIRKAREMGFFQTPGSLKRRGQDFIPHFRTDADVIKIYSERLINSYFNHLYALQAKMTIDGFVNRDPMGKTKGENAKGEEIDIDLTNKWAMYMRDIARKVLGYPTHFTTEPGDSNATFIGHSKKMMKAYAKTVRTGVLNRLSRDKMNAYYIGQGMQPIPEFKTKEEEAKWMTKNQLYVDVLKEALSQEANPLQVYGSGYYYTSDTMMVNLIQRVGEKIAGRDSKGNIKLPWKNLPTDPIARKMALTSLVHKFGSFEAKWSLATLLTHPKTAIGNIFGGSMNTISSASFRHWKNAGNYQYLLRNVFKEATLADGTKITSREHIGRLMEELGVLEAFYVQEIGLDPTFSQANRNQFMKAVTKKMAERGLFKSGTTDAQIKETIGELAQKYKVGDWLANKAAYFMRISERPLRQRAFLAHYLNAREALAPITDAIPFDSPWLLSQAIKGVTSTQFLYNSAARSNYSNTAIGKVMTRFQPFAWNSLAFRKRIYRDAKTYGFKPGSKDFNRFRRQMTMDLFVFGLGNVFASSIFEYAMPPPMSWMQDTAQFFFGDEKERERAFFSQWPVISKKNILAPLQPFTGPILRYPLNTIALFTEGGLEKFSQYYIWTWFPFGRAARDIRKTIMSPAMVLENVTGFPLHQVHTKARSMYKDWFPEEEEDLIPSPSEIYQAAYK